MTLNEQLELAETNYQVPRINQQQCRKHFVGAFRRGEEHPRLPLFLAGDYQCDGNTHIGASFHQSFRYRPLPRLRDASCGVTKVVTMKSTLIFAFIWSTLTLQELLSEGLADGFRMNHMQYKAMLARDRTIKRVRAQMDGWTPAVFRFSLSCRPAST